ncbi:iron-sulfur cluster assembly scaffold protein, partial [Burkholderia multivorans]
LMHSRGTGEADEEILGDAAAFQGVSKFPARIKCALLAWMAFKDALGQAQAGTDATADSASADNEEK